MAFTHGWPNPHPAYAPKDDEQFARLKRLMAKFDALSGTTLFKWRLDGFVLVFPSRIDTDTLLTKPLVFTGNQFEVNADATNGRLCVAIQDHEGQPLPGYGFGDCEPLTADQVHHVFRWCGDRDLTMLAGKAVRLLFELRGQTRLYAFQFTGYGPSRGARARATRPWDFVDLYHEIEVGSEVRIEPKEINPPRIVPQWVINQRCARSRMPILGFDKVRIFQHPQGPEQRLCFLEQCFGKVRIVSQDK